LRHELHVLRYIETLANLLIHFGVTIITHKLPRGVLP